MKRILIVLAMAVTTFTACNIGENGYDGDAYIKLNWGGGTEPSYIDAGGVVPNNFNWDTFYYTLPGVYTVYTEYEEVHYSTNRTVVYPYSVEIEIFVIEGDPGRTHGRDGRDANEDVFFDLELFPSGDIDFTHEILPKSATIDEKVVVKEGSEQSGQYGMKYTIYRLPEYVK